MPTKWVVAGGRIDRRRMNFFIDRTRTLTEAGAFCSISAGCWRSPIASTGTA
jgi:hypothetical protein